MYNILFKEWKDRVYNFTDLCLVIHIMQSFPVDIVQDRYLSQTIKHSDNASTK